MISPRCSTGALIKAVTDSLANQIANHVQRHLNDEVGGDTKNDSQPTILSYEEDNKVAQRAPLSWADCSTETRLSIGSEALTLGDNCPLFRPHDIVEHESDRLVERHLIHLEFSPGPLLWVI